jgi:hypothetical protein
MTFPMHPHPGRSLDRHPVGMDLPLPAKEEELLNLRCENIRLRALVVELIVKNENLRSLARAGGLLPSSPPWTLW